MFSVLILTRNEETNLPACLHSLAWCDDIVVLDSFSTDDTIKLATAAGARVYQRAFDNFAAQRNYSLDSIPFRYPWVFHLDADEQFTSGLHAECLRAVQEDQVSGFMVPSKIMFMGRWLQHSGMYPCYQMRLLKIGEIRFQQHGHGQREAEAKRGVATLQQPYLHFNFSKGMADWFEKHNRYSTEELTKNSTSVHHAQPSIFNLFSEAFFCRDALGRWRALKTLSQRLPCRPTLRFLYMYFVRAGFLDGIPGYHYCRLLGIYEYMMVMKMKELSAREKGLKW